MLYQSLTDTLQLLEREPRMDDTRAVFWIANKDPYLTEATNSARSVKRCMPDVTRVLFCPSWVVVFADDFDEVIDLPEPPHESWWTNSVYYLWKTSEILFYHGITEALYLDTEIGRAHV